MSKYSFPWKESIFSPRDQDLVMVLLDWFKNPDSPTNFVHPPRTQKIQLEKEHDPVAIVADKALVKLFNKTTIMQLM